MVPGLLSADFAQEKTFKQQPKWVPYGLNLGKPVLDSHVVIN